MCEKLRKYVVLREHCESWMSITKNCLPKLLARPSKHQLEISCTNDLRKHILDQVTTSMGSSSLERGVEIPMIPYQL